MKILYFLILNILLLVNLYSNPFTEALEKDLNKKDNIYYLAQYKYLTSLGWKFEFVKQKSPIKIITGNPFDFNSFYEIKDSNASLTFFIDDSIKDFDSAIEDLKTTYFPKAIENFATTKSWKVKFGSSVSNVKQNISETILWPNFREDALGLGWENIFTKGTASEKEVDDLCLKLGSDKDSCDKYYVQSLLSFWHFKSTKRKPLSNALQSILATEHTAGCLVALNSFLHLTVFDTFKDNIKIFDSTFNEIKINNYTFHTTKLFPKQSTVDLDGSKKAKLGRWGLIGHGAYLKALITNNITDQDYNGENIIITEMSEKAAQSLLNLGLGASEGEIWDEEELEERLKENFYYGFTYRMINWWKEYNKKYVYYFKKEFPQVSREDLYEDDLDTLHENTLENLSTKAKKILAEPFFTETKVWGHPTGELTLKDWIHELALKNPYTPYSISIYDYFLGESHCTNYVNAFLDPEEKSTKTAIRNCKKIN